MLFTNRWLLVGCTSLPQQLQTREAYVPLTRSGSLRLPSTPPRVVPGGITAEFVSVVTPMPETYLQNLAAKNPDIYQRRVTRPMVAAIKI